MVYSFGCSFTYGKCNDEQLDSHFTKLVADYYNTGYVNTGMNGASNQDVFERFSSKLLDFKEGDLVIIGLTTPDRGFIPQESIIPPNMNARFWEDLFFSEQPYDENHPFFGKPKSIQGSPVTSICFTDGLSLYFKRQGHKFAGYRDIDQFVGDFFRINVLYYDAVRDNIKEHYGKLFYNMSLKLNKRGVKVVMWDYDSWVVIKLANNKAMESELSHSCECGHWNERGHSLFSKLLINAFESEGMFTILNCRKALSEYIL
jgi:hypothetical protein